MEWDVCESDAIIKILPAMLWHKKARLLDFGWLRWSFVIKFH